MRTFSSVSFNTPLPPTTSTLFPYTTLFRSSNPVHLEVWLNGTQKISFNDSSTSQISRSEEHTSELQSRGHLVCRLLLEKKNSSGKMNTPLMGMAPLMVVRERPSARRYDCAM